MAGRVGETVMKYPVPPPEPQHPRDYAPSTPLRRYPTIRDALYTAVLALLVALNVILLLALNLA